MILICQSVVGVQKMLNECVDIADSLSLTFNANKLYCIAIGKLHSMDIADMSLGINAIHWASSIKYLGVHICNGKSMSFDTDVIKRRFLLPAIVFFLTHLSNELMQLSLQESYSLPILTYAISVLNLSTKQSAELNACWNSVHIRIFSFNRWESVKCFVSGMERLYFYHIVSL
jgi:hypothetical protein